MNPVAARHLSVEDFAGYLATGVPIDHPVPGAPRLTLFTDPPRARIGLRGPAVPNETLPAEALENLTVHTIHHDGQRLIEIAVTEPRIFTDAYPLLCAVADRVQLDGQPMSRALAETLRRLGHLLRREDAPTLEVEIGLIGELTLLTGILDATDATTALQAWRTGSTEEHDFALPTIDVEVKTTTTERRQHWISSLQQLVPTGERPLWLVSLQITRAGSTGSTLGDLAQRVRERFTAVGDPGPFDAHLRAAGWRDSYATHAQQRWRLRTAPAGFAVSGGFPRLTPDLLSAAGIDPSHMPEVKYRIDLSGRNPDTCPDELIRSLHAGQRELS